MSSGSSAGVSSCLNIATARVIVIVIVQCSGALRRRIAGRTSAEPTSHRSIHGGTVLILAALVLLQASNAVGWRS